MISTWVAELYFLGATPGSISLLAATTERLPRNDARWTAALPSGHEHSVSIAKSTCSRVFEKPGNRGIILKSDVEKTQWKRLSIEAIAIVGSILLAFAIDAWWDDRKHRVREQEALHDLLAEYEDHKADIAGATARHLDYLRVMEQLLDACKQRSWSSDKFSVDEAIFALLVPETIDLGEGVRDTLVSSGKLEIFSDRDLRYLLAEWGSVLDELLDDQLMSADVIINVVLPYLTRVGVPLSGPLSTAPGQEHSSITNRYLSVDSEPIATICADPEFLSIVELRYGYMVHTAFEFNRVMTAIDSMLLRIEDSLAD